MSAAVYNANLFVTIGVSFDFPNSGQVIVIEYHQLPMKWSEASFGTLKNIKNYS